MNNNLEECLKTELKWLSQQGNSEDQTILEEKQAVAEAIKNFMPWSLRVESYVYMERLGLLPWGAT